MAKKAMSIAQLRNLPQYKGMDDEELERIRSRILLGGFDDQIEDHIKSFQRDYDLTDMSANDKLSLLELARVFVLLEELDKRLNSELNSKHPDWVAVEKINRVIAQLRSDASTLQKDLNITRRARQDSKGQSVVDFIEDLKKRGKLFLKDRLAEIYCPKCKMLLCKVWFLYPDDDQKITLVCKRDSCGYKFTVKPSDYANNRNKNINAGPPL